MKRETEVGTSKNALSNEPGEEPEDERRLTILRATRRVIAREGFDKASMRAIARELGTTTGVLTHHFRNKEEILDLVLRAARYGKYDGRFAPDAGFADLVDALTSTLPHNDDNLDAWKVYFGFLAYIFPRAEKAESYAVEFERWRKSWASTIESLARRGVIRKDIDPRLAADTLLCLFEGAGVHGVVSPASFGGDRQNAVMLGYFQTLLAEKVSDRD